MTPVLRYLWHGKVRHLLIDASMLTAECGVSPLWYDSAQWRGTGNQEEYETLRSLRNCQQCYKRLPRTMERAEGELARDA